MESQKGIEHELKMVLLRELQGIISPFSFGNPYAIEEQESNYLCGFPIVENHAILAGGVRIPLGNNFPNNFETSPIHAYRLRYQLKVGKDLTGGWHLAIKGPKDPSGRGQDWSGLVSNEHADVLLQTVTHSLKKFRFITDHNGLVYHMDVHKLVKEETPMLLIEVQDPPIDFKPPEGWQIVTGKEWAAFNIALNQKFPY